MAIFSNTITDKYDIPVYEGYSFEVCGHYDALTESLEDSLSITEAMHAFDMAEIEGLRRIKALRESNEDKDDEIEEEEEKLESTLEASGKEILTKIGEAIKKLWGKITAFFRSIMNHLKSLLKRRKEIISYTEDDVLKALNGRRFIHSVYDYMIFDRVRRYDAKNIISTVYSLNTVLKWEDKDLIKKGEVDFSRINKYFEKTVNTFTDEIRSLEETYKKRTVKVISSEYMTGFKSFVDKQDEIFKVIENNKKELDRVFKEVTLSIDSIKNKYSTSEQLSFAAKIANYLQNECSTYGVLITQLTNLQVECVKKIVGDYDALCRYILMNEKKL